MGKSLRYKKGHYDEKILDLVRAGPIEWNDFTTKCKEMEIPLSTVYKRIKQLITYGLIVHVNIVKLSEKYQEVRYEEIREILVSIKKSQTEIILQERFKQLQLFSQGLRVVHHPGIILTFETCLDSSRIYQNNGIFEEMMNALYNMLRFERENPSPNSELYIKELTGDILSKIIKIIKRKPGFISRNTLMYFRETGKESVVNLFFDKIRSHAADVDVSNLNLNYVLGSARARKEMK